jgi:hypothetical protein
MIARPWRSAQMRLPRANSKMKRSQAEETQKIPVADSLAQRRAVYGGNACEHRQGSMREAFARNLRTPPHAYSVVTNSVAKAACSRCLG